MSRDKQRANRREKDRRILTLAKKERLTKEEWLKREAEKRAQIEAEKAAKLLSEEMENAVELSLKLTADAGIGKTWYDAKG